MACTKSHALLFLAKTLLERGAKFEAGNFLGFLQQPDLDVLEGHKYFEADLLVDGALGQKAEDRSL